MVRHAVLGEVVGSDFFLAAAAADQAAAMGGVFLAFLANFVFEQAGAEDLESALAVLDLAATVLAANDFAGGDVKNLDSGIGCIDALTAGAAGATNFDAKVFGADFNIYFFGFGEDSDGGGGGMDAALGFGGGDALDAMDAALVAEAAEDAFATYAKNDLFEAAEVGGAVVELFDAKAYAIGILAIHSVEVGSEEGGFGAASACADFDDGVAFFTGFGWEERGLELALECGDALAEGFDFLLGESDEFGVSVGFL